MVVDGSARRRYDHVAAAFQAPSSGAGSEGLASEDALRVRYALTPQEARVALLLAERKSNAEIAEVLFISYHTAKHHVERVLEKLGAASRKEVGALIGMDRGA